MCLLGESVSAVFGVDPTSACVNGQCNPLQSDCCATYPGIDCCFPSLR
jgi:hypothetical protein